MSKASRTKRFRLIDLLRPHWKSLSLAFLAVLGVTLTDLLEPWPLKLVFDHLLKSKPLPEWLNHIASTFGTDDKGIRPRAGGLKPGVQSQKPVIIPSR